MEKTVQADTTIELRPVLPDAFKIKNCDESTYAEVLGIFKEESELKALQEMVTPIRGTKVGELLLQMDKLSSVIHELQTLVSCTLARSAIVQTLSNKEAIDIKDLDETTTAE